MTAEELRRLAEIAGVSISKYYSDFYTKNISKRKEIAIMVKDWRPHLRIEQAMMVAEAFTAFYVGKDIGQYFCRLAVTNCDLIKYLPKVHSTSLPLAICRAALAAAKEV